MARAEKSSNDEPVVQKLDKSPNPVWFIPVMVGLMLLGLAWIMVFYISGAVLPIPDIGSWNLVIGFVIAFAGFMMTLKWR